MLVSRLFKPKSKELIYHYCSAQSFHSICANKTIRLCDVFSMNDYMEMHWGYSIWEKAASELLDVVGEDFLDKIDNHIHLSGVKGLLIASSFSLAGDVLSQWRAYADDGNGYVIGFRAKDILNLPIRFLKIEYNVKKQINEVKRFIHAIDELERMSPDKFGDEFKLDSNTLAYDLVSFKNPAFSEEKEVRIIHLLSFVSSNRFLKLQDDGGHAFGEPTSGNEVKFLMSNNVPKAYVDFDFSNNGKINPIKEVIIGPKNPALQTAISVYLETMNLGDVVVKKSNASYR